MTITTFEGWCDSCSEMCSEGVFVTVTGIESLLCCLCRDMDEPCYICEERSVHNPWDVEPDTDFMFETDSALASAGFGTDEDYGN